MPELPEVETVRRGLQPVLEGRLLTSVVQRRPDLRFPMPERLADRLAGRRVRSVGRRAKYILVELDDANVLLLHLGMSGRLLVLDDGAVAPGPHDHIDLVTDAGVTVRFNDVRRFGILDLVPAGGLATHRLLAGLGPEPLGNRFGADVLGAALRGRRSPIKAALLDQRVVAGLGNIYVCEVLHRAGVSPRRKAGRIAAARVAALVPAIREVLMAAIEAGGSSLRDYRQADGELGYFQHAFRVYDREGAPCPAPGCGGTIRRIVQSGRSTFYCARCQH